MFLLLYLFDCKPRIMFFFPSIPAVDKHEQLTVKGGLLFFFTIPKGLDNAHSFLCHVLSTELSFAFSFFSSASRAHQR